MTTHIGGTRNKENQDRFFVTENVYAVFDGHGADGSLIAQKMKEHFLADPNAWSTANDQLTGLTGGTTATVVTLTATEIHVKNLGDSEAWFFPATTEIPAYSLTADHSATSKSEWDRIHASHPKTAFRFDGDRQIPVFTDDGLMNRGQYYNSVNKTWGAYVCHPTEARRLAVTRALGDFDMVEAGVIAEPSHQIFPRRAGTIVIASDGVWNCLTYAEVASLCTTEEAIMTATLASGRTNFGSGADNATVVVVKIDA